MPRGCYFHSESYRRRIRLGGRGTCLGVVSNQHSGLRVGWWLLVGVILSFWREDKLVLIISYLSLW
jgi:hypothetical protein